LRCPGILDHGTNGLTPQEKKQFAELMGVIKEGTTEAQISAVYPLKKKDPPMHVGVNPPNILSYRATFNVLNKTGNLPPSTVNVYFTDNRAIIFEWWADGLQKHVNVILTT
jgi:hypothetical protein